MFSRHYHTTIYLLDLAFCLPANETKEKARSHEKLGFCQEENMYLLYRRSVDLFLLKLGRSKQPWRRASIYINRAHLTTAGKALGFSMHLNN